jgi:uncharacterized protein involved in outer membrane biogenesis
MQKKHTLFKSFFYTLIALILLFFASLFYLVHQINTGPIKNQLHDIVLKNTGLTLKIHGDISLQLLPRLNLAAKDIDLYTSEDFAQESPLMHVHDFRAMINPFILLGHTLSIDKIYMDNVRAHLKVTADNKVNWQPLEPPRPPSEVLPYQLAFNSNTILLKHLNVDYVNDHSQTHWQLEEGNFLTKDIALASPTASKRLNYSHLLRDLDIIARLRAKKLTYNNRSFANINVQMNGHQHKVALSNIEFDHAGGHGAGEIQANLAYFVPQYQMHLTLSGIDSIPDLLQKQAFNAKACDIDLKLRSQGHGMDTLMQQAHGTITVHAIDGIIEGLSIQKAIDDMRVAMLKGNKLSLQQQAKTTRFNHANLNISLESGIAFVNDMLLGSNDFSLHTHGLYNFKNSQWNLYLLLTLLNPKHKIIQQEFDQFFRKELANTVPAMVFGTNNNIAFMLDTDFIDVGKMMLGDATNRLLKGSNYQPYEHEEAQIKKDIYQILYPMFNDDSPAAP